MTSADRLPTNGLPWRERIAASLRARVVAQFHRPHGVLGRVAGLVLARRPSNRLRNQWAVDLLAIESDHRVLELGFGPGLAIEACARRAPSGRVVGVDHSETMTHVARRRNARAVAEGRVVLHTASFDALADLDLGGPFDRILAVNAVMFARDADALLRELVRRLRPGGRIAVVFQSRRRGATSADSIRVGEATVDALRRAGLDDVRTENLPLLPVAAVCAIGTRSP